MDFSEEKASRGEDVYNPKLDIERWAAPFYLSFLHGNFKNTDSAYSATSHRRSWEEWRTLLRRELTEVTPEVVSDLIMDRNWRTQICGAYFCGFKRWSDLTRNIGNQLVAKKNIYSTQGYAFALARIPSHAAADYLCDYLSCVGRPEDTTNWYGSDLDWVIASLQWVDAQMVTNRLAPYTQTLVSFQQQQRMHTHFSTEDNAWHSEWFSQLMKFCELHIDSPST